MSWTDIARRQGGLIARAQLRAEGVAAGTVDGWLATGRLDATAANGVYRVSGAPDSAATAAWFAALATRSVVSFRSAARWWDMPVADDGLAHITRPGRRRLDWPSGVRVHRVALAGNDVVRRRGLWVTTRPVTALDCIGSLPRGQALTFAHRAFQQNWLTRADVVRRLDGSPGRWGNRQIGALTAVVERGAEAESERRLHRLLRSAGVSGWVAQHAVATPAGHFRVDVAFPAIRLAIEVDGYAYHSHDERFQQDRTKQNALLAAGWRVLRFTWADLVERPQHVLAQIASLLAA